jgi:hypothetical protein
MIGEHINFSGGSLIEVMIPRETPEKSAEVYKRIGQAINDKYYPILVGHIEKQQIQKKAHECKTMKELEAVPVEYLTDDFYKFMADELNSYEELNDSERIFMLTQLSDRIIFSSRQWVDQVMHQRAQVLARTEKKIILP